MFFSRSVHLALTALHFAVTAIVSPNLLVGSSALGQDAARLGQAGDFQDLGLVEGFS